MVRGSSIKVFSLHTACLPIASSHRTVDWYLHESIEVALLRGYYSRGSRRYYRGARLQTEEHYPDGRLRGAYTDALAGYDRVDFGRPDTSRLAIEIVFYVGGLSVNPQPRRIGHLSEASR